MNHFISIHFIYFITKPQSVSVLVPKNSNLHWVTCNTNNSNLYNTIHLNKAINIPAPHSQKPKQSKLIFYHSDTQLMQKICDGNTKRSPHHCSVSFKDSSSHQMNQFEKPQETRSVEHSKLKPMFTERN